MTGQGSVIVLRLQFLNMKLSFHFGLKCEKVLQLYLQFVLLPYEMYFFYHYVIFILLTRKQSITSSFCGKPWLIFEGVYIPGKNVQLQIVASVL